MLSDLRGRRREEEREGERAAARPWGQRRENEAERQGQEGWRLQTFEL